VRHSHATGNDADVTVCELAIAVAEDPAVKLLLLYLESIPDPHHLAEAARIAHERDLPIIVLKSGRTTAGQAAARSHTGALANEDRLVDAFLEQHGIWRAKDTTDFVEAAELYLKGWKPSGRRLVAISNSGATCVLAADAASMAGVSLAPLSEQTQGRLREILPSFAAVGNPVDITAALLTNSRLFGEILPVIAKDPSADAFLVGVPVAGQGYDVEAFARDTAAFADSTGKPLVVVAPQPPVADRFKARGLPVFAGEGEAVRSLHQFIAHGELAARAKARPPVQPGAPTHPEQTQARMLNEAESLALIREAGVPVISHRLCRAASEAVRFFKELGGPAAVKGCSGDVAHKTELGLVHLGIADTNGIRQTYEQCRRALEENGLSFDGVIVAAMARGRREMLIGAHRDPVFGPVVVVGDGGKYVEAMPDVRVLLAPFGAEDVRRALHTLRIAPVLGGVRGEPPLDVDAYCDAAVAVGRLMSAPGSAIATLDINPMLLGAQGQGCMAVDAVVFTT
jgi:acyl-CoA synthetase (NDP forming)